MPVIRDAVPADAAAIAEIYTESIVQGDATMDETPWTPAQVTGMMAAHSAREGFIVLEHGGEVLGWGVYKRYSPRTGYRFAGETATYLRRDKTGAGHGSRLKRALIERCRASGYRHLVARVFADNAASVAYNQRLGYTVVGTQRQIGFRSGRWVDVTILQLIL
ncbi:MAG: GNAT family N-acetyltransferase [Myxococcota bacterium]|nr:GNAT family N-acetyltransferase [Myxococcota bacterium]